MVAKKRKPKVAFTKKTQEFIIDKMESENLLIEQICKKYPKQTPDVRSIYKFQAKNPDFEERVNQAYNVWLMSKIAELEHVSTASLEELFPKITEKKDAYEARRARMDALKFTLGKMAPILSARWSKATKVEHSGIDQPNIIIQKYVIPGSLNESKDKGYKDDKA